MVRYRREDEVIVDAIRATRRSSREANRPTGTEKALTMETAGQAAEQSGEAISRADEAAAKAAEAKMTADGRNRIYAQMIEPVTMPELPFVPGDVWYRLDTEGRIAEVRVWNGTLWNGFQLVAGSLLVPGSVGNVLIADGAVTGQKIAADAIDGKTITGATLRTAAAGQRMQFDWSGLRSFDYLGALTASLAAGSGGFTIGGMLYLSGDVEGVTRPRTFLSKSNMQIEDGADLGGSPSKRFFANSTNAFVETRVPGSGPSQYGTSYAETVSLPTEARVGANYNPPDSPPGYQTHEASLSASATSAYLVLRGPDVNAYVRAADGRLEFRDAPVKFSTPVAFSSDASFAGEVTVRGYPIPTETALDLANITVRSGYTLNWASSWARRSTDGIVRGQISVDRSSGTLESGADLAFLPSLFRPTGNWEGPCMTSLGGTADANFGQILPTGGLRVWSPAAGNRRATWNFQFKI